MNLFTKVIEQEKKAEEFGFAWETLEQLLDQTRSECNEIEEAYRNEDKNHLKEEIGDLLQAAISVAAFCNVDPEEALTNSINKFHARFSAVVALAKEQGLEHLKGLSFGELMDFWNEAKKNNSLNQESRDHHQKD